MEEELEKHKGLVISIVNSFKPKNIDEREEYIQVGMIGLWKALTKYDSTVGCKFAPFATNPIRWEIIKHINKQNKHIMVQFPNKQDFPNQEKVDIGEIIPDSLSNEEKKILELRLMGHTFKDICVIIQREKRKTRKLFETIIQKMRSCNE